MKFSELVLVSLIRRQRSDLFGMSVVSGLVLVESKLGTFPLKDGLMYILFDFAYVCMYVYVYMYECIINRYVNVSCNWS